MVQSWLLNIMEPHAKIFSYSEYAADLWDAVKEMFGNQNNVAHMFQLTKKDISCLHQEGKSFVQYFENIKNMWNELVIYWPHIIDAATLLKQA